VINRAYHYIGHNYLASLSMPFLGLIISYSIYPNDHGFWSLINMGFFLVLFPFLGSTHGRYTFGGWGGVRFQRLSSLL
jgi:hypothetical protein